MPRDTGNEPRGAVQRITRALEPLRRSGALPQGWRFRRLELAHVGIDALFEHGDESARFRFLRRAIPKLWCRVGDLGVALVDVAVPASFPTAALAEHLQRTLSVGSSEWPRWAPDPPVMVIASGIPRSGTGWVKRILRSLIQGSGHSLDSEDGETKLDADYAPRGPGNEKESRQALHDAIRLHRSLPRSIRLVKAHHFAGSALTNAPAFRVLFTYRDLRDVLVSVLHRLRHGAADGLFTDSSDEAIFDWLVDTWLPETVRVLTEVARVAPPPTTLLVRYERLLAQPEVEADRLAAHLGVHLPPDFRNAIIEQRSFRREAGRTSGSEQPASYHRRGVAGRWEEDLSAAQLSRIERRAPDLDDLLMRLDARMQEQRQSGAAVDGLPGGQ